MKSSLPSHQLKVALSDQNICDLVTKKYSSDELTDIFQLDVSMYELDQQYPIECLKKEGEYYTASYLGNNTIATITFNGSGQRIFGWIYDMSLSKEDFSQIVIGQSFEDVKKFDPKGDYTTFYTGVLVSPRVSNHYTKDGYLIRICYDDEAIITDITTILI